MLGTHDLWVFVLASFLLWITAGPDTMYILARSIAQGRAAGVLSVFGISSGILVHTLFAAFGLSIILTTSAWAFTIVKISGAAYLIYLGVQVFRQRIEGHAASDVTAMDAWQVYRQALLCNVLNPKVAIFFLAFLPQFVDPEARLGPLPFLFLGTVFVVGGTLWCLVVSVCAASAATTIRRNSRLMTWLERGSGCVYIGLGLNLLRSKPQAA